LTLGLGKWTKLNAAVLVAFNCEHRDDSDDGLLQ
ncbi:MAG: hypothetical protein ACI9MS_000430, partial [Glaciecola sp.]